MLRKTSYNKEEMMQFVAKHEPFLIPDQSLAYHCMLDKINSEMDAFYSWVYLEGQGRPSSSTSLLAEVRRSRMIALAVASSGIAATPLTDSVHFAEPVSATGEIGTACW